MKYNEKMFKVCADIEYLIGNTCYNPNSYDGYTGEEGREYRYPVWVDEDDGFGKKEAHKHSLRIWDYKENSIGSWRYKFGSNHLYVGEAILKIMNYLEDRYNLDFNELEEKHDVK